VMIVDLSRHDLYPSCEVNSVEVPELFAIKTFPLVHQMVSTITGRLAAKVHPVEALLGAFPPGSMTGAPKVRVCQLVDKYEKSARGIYSGAAGYFDPAHNFDLNVVIRSLIVDDHAGKLSYHAGGAITWDSQPEAEYDETLLKAAVLTRLFGEDALG
jgi:para-aminobenzoate synthetase component I